MRFFGYAQNHSDLLELTEVSLQASPDALLAMAAFLTETAHQMKTHGSSFGHEHYQDWQSASPQWPKMDGDFIIVNKYQ